MASINSNNFIIWDNPPVTLTNEEFTTDLTGWFNDLHPINGAGGEQWDWDSANGGQAEASGTPNYSQGLAQLVTIKKGFAYVFDVEIGESNDPSTKRIYFVDDDGNYQILLEETQGINETVYQFTAVADANYTKVVHTSDIIPSGLNTQSQVLYFRMDEVATLDCQYALPLYAGDEIKHLLNTVLDEYTAPFGGSKVGLWDADNSQIYLRDIATLNYLDLGGDNYTFYFEYTVPASIIEGHLRFVIYKDVTGSDEIIYISNLFQKITSTNYTSFIKYRNSKNALDYYWENLASFYNQFRVDMRTGRPQWRQQTIGYETYQGQNIYTRTNIQKPYDFETRFLDEIAHEAIFAVFQMSEFYIDDVEYEKPSGAEYAVTWSEHDDKKIGNGSIELNKVSYSKAIKSC